MGFGTFIRQHREEFGISLKDFAASLLVSPSYWSRVERELEKPPKDALVQSAARELGVSSDDAFVAAGRLPPDIIADIRTAVRIYRERCRAECRV